MASEEIEKRLLYLARSCGGQESAAMVEAAAELKRARGLAMAQDHHFRKVTEGQARQIDRLTLALQWIIDVDPVFMRSADQHPSYCKCHRCAMDNARAIMEASNG